MCVCVCVCVCVCACVCEGQTRATREKMVNVPTPFVNTTVKIAPDLDSTSSFVFLVSWLPVSGKLRLLIVSL